MALSPPIISLVPAYFPLGGSPVASLTRTLPVEEPARVLLLGCGDMRNILFTCYAEDGYDRPLDITFSDIEAAVLARNILLTCTLLDTEVGEANTRIWAMFHHYRITPVTLELLHTQTSKLINYSKNAAAWEASPYGKIVHICNESTLVQLGRIWTKWHSLSQSRKHQTSIRWRVREAIESVMMKQQFGDTTTAVAVAVVANGENITPAPASYYEALLPSGNTSEAIVELQRLFRFYWESGSTNQDPRAPKAESCLNPTFFAGNGTSFAHHTTNPLTAFHLATAFVGLEKDSPLKRDGLMHFRVVDVAKHQFFTWIEAFRDRIVRKKSTILRFVVADAIPMCHALWQRNNTEMNGPVCFRDQLSMDPLAFTVHQSSATGIPDTFNVIDTSDLVDTISSIGLLSAASRLLDKSAVASLHTESLIAVTQDIKQVIRGMLIGDLSTMSLIMGLVPVDFWSNTSPSSTSEVKWCLTHPSTLPRKTTLRSSLLRLSWKRLPLDIQNTGDAGNEVDRKIVMMPVAVARMIYKVYQAIFEVESSPELFLQFQKTDQCQHPSMRFQRPSLITFVHCIMENVRTDWNQAMLNLRNLLEVDRSSLLTMNFLQEIHAYLHVMGLHTISGLKPSPISFTSVGRTRYHPSSIRPEIDGLPSVCCVTLLVPRSALGVLTRRDSQLMGNPVVQCVIQGAEQASTAMRWKNIFSGVQLAFGEAEYDSKEKTTRVMADQKGLEGSASLIASFLAPTWLLLDSSEEILLEFSLRGTPEATTVYTSKLGLMYTVHSVKVGDEKSVFLSKTWPNCSKEISPVPIRASPTTPTRVAAKSEGRGGATTFMADFETVRSKIEILVSRVEITSPALKEAMTQGLEFHLDSVSSCQILLQMGNCTEKTIVNFPCPIVHEFIVVKVDDDVAFIDVSAPIASFDTWKEFPMWSVPRIPEKQPAFGPPMLFNYERLNVDGLPIIDCHDMNEPCWLLLHIQSMLSHPEFVGMGTKTIELAENPRVNFKSSLFDIFMYFLEKQETYAPIFLLNSDSALRGVSQIIIVGSSLRLDLNSRTVVLDAGVIVVKEQIEIAKILSEKTMSNVRELKLDTHELLIWLTLLPAMTERCRGQSWVHNRHECEYRSTEIPDLTTNSILNTSSMGVCGCGQGVFPSGFCKQFEADEWKELSRHATRAVISPYFSSPVVEDQMGPKAMQTAMLSVGKCKKVEQIRCLFCGRDEREGGGKLLVCAKCMRAQYCSRNCQKAHLKNHSPVCVAQAEKSD